jgi:hypothetical protein
MLRTIHIGQEVVARKAFVWATDWPGWCRSGKDVDLARAALIDAGARYANVARRAGLEFPDVAEDSAFEVDVEVEGNGGTEFGVPSIITDDDRHRVTSAQATRIASLVEAAWAELDAIAKRTPETLRKGPRGGGRDRDKMLDHVFMADHAYAHEIGLKLPAGSLEDRKAVRDERAAVLEVLGRASDGAPLANRKWTLRYAARRIAWHALDHAWEMLDRTEPSD